MKQERINKTIEELQKEVEELRFQLTEANETIEAIRTGQIDALVVQGQEGHQLYSLKSADQTYRVFIEKMTEGAVTPAGSPSTVRVVSPLNPSTLPRLTFSPEVPPW